MVREILKIRTDNGLGNNNPTFKGIELTDYSAKFPRMGMPSLSATLKWATPLDDEWTGKEYVTLRGERFYIRHTPSGKKDNQDSRYNHELEFTSEFSEILGNTYFEDAVPSYAETYDKPCTNSTKFTFYGTIGEFVDRLNCAFIKAGIADSVLKTKTSLAHTDTPVGDGYCAILDPYGAGDIYDPNKSYEFSFEDKFLWEAITYGYETTEIPFERRGKIIIFGAIPNVVSHKFEYGHDNELLSVYHKNANAKVINRITMLGSSENIPHYYPNETEYGHIDIVADEDNSVLTTEMINIVNMTQLLSRLNADSTAVFGKYGGEDVGDAKVEIDGFSTCFGDFNNFTAYTLKTYKEHKSVENDRNTTIPWHVRVLFKVKKEGVVVCRNVRGHIWKVNEPQPTDDTDYIGGITPERLFTPESKPQGIESVDYSSQIRKDGDVINLGRLQKGDYFFQFSINVIKRGGGRNEPIHTKCYLSDVVINGADKQKTGYYWAVGDKKYDGAGSLGIKIDGSVTDAMIGDGFKWEASGRMPFQTNLVPPKYRNTLGDERFYNALNAPYSEEYATEHPDAYKDPDTNSPYEFPNPFIKDAPSEHIHKNEGIKPTIEGITNNVQRKDVNGALMFDDNGNPIYQLFGEIADIAYDADDNDSLKAESSEDGDKNDSLKYEHSFFYIKLNIFNGTYGFDLFAHASQTDAMTIQMREGSCNGCKFKIQAAKFTDSDGLETYKNPIVVRNGVAVGVVSEDGIKESDLDPAQQNTQTHSIWICVQKDAETLGVIMPNKSNNFKPAIGDTFNIINIDLPEGYIRAAEKRLEEEGMRYMADNNEDKFTFDIQASRIFFAENPDVLAQLDEYSVIKVKYNGKEYEQYVNQLTIVCKDGEALPNIGIDLTDTLAVGESFVDQVAERASSLIANPYTMGGASGGGGGLTTRLADQRYLKKTESDRSKGKIASDIGFEVGNFVSGGSGGIFYQDPETGQTYIEADKLKIRMKAIFEELEIAKVSTIGGKFIITPGGGLTISFVEELTNSYRCYFKAKDEDKGAECRFVIGDQVQCHEFNVQNGTIYDASNRYYWRLVTAVNNAESYIELSKTDRDNAYDIPSDAPQAGDTIVQLGNRNDAERQSAIVLSTVDAFAPCVTLYNGIDSYSLANKAVVEYGVDKTKNPPEPFFNCYGRFYFGPRPQENEDGELVYNSYLKFEPSIGKLIFSGELVNITSLNGKDIDKYITDLIPEPDLSQYDYLKEAIKDGATTTRGGLILTSLIKLGEWNLTNPENPQQNKIWAGINGIRNHDKTIASWWGGDMVDKYYNDSVTPRPTPLTTGFAAALVRMDGTGYLSKGNIGWDSDGSGWLANKNIIWDGAGNITFGSGIKINLGTGGDTTLQGIADSLASLTQAILNINNNFTPIVKKVVGTTETFIETTWDKITTANPLYAVKSTKGFYSEEFISALGLNAAGGSGSGSGFGLLRTWTDPTNYPDDAFSAQVVWNKINSLPTTSVNPFGLTIQKNGTTLGTYDGSSAKTINISDVASAATLSSHTGNTTVHITAVERTKWNTASSNLDTILGSDASGTLNKWNEIVDFLATYTEADTLANLLSNKVSKSGDTMTGALTVPRLTISSTSQVGHLAFSRGSYNYVTAPASGSIAFVVNGKATGGSTTEFLISNGLVTSGQQNNAVSLGSSSYRWSNIYSVLGNFSEKLTADTLTIGSTSGVAHLAFSRGSSNYFTAPAGGFFCFVANGKSANDVNSDLQIRENEIMPGTTNLVTMGTSSRRWANVWSVLGNFSGQVTAQSLKIGDCEITWDAANGGLKFSKGIYSEEFVSALGVNNSGTGGSGGLIQNVYSWNNLGESFSNDTLTDTFNAFTINKLYTDKADKSWVEAKGYLTSSSLSDYVTLNTAQTISAQKTFTANQRANAAIFFKNKDTADGIYLNPMSSGILYLQAHTNYGYKGDVGYFTRDGSAVFQKFIKIGGTSSQFLKADGSVDSTSYLASSSYNASDVLAKIKTVDGADSGLDADLLDGYHSYNFDVVRQETIDLSDLDANTWYPVLFTLTVGCVSDIRVMEASRSVWGTNDTAVNGKKKFWCSAHWQSSGNGWGALSLTRYIYQSNSNWDGGVSVIGEIGQLANSSNEYIYLRGGASYLCRATNCSSISRVTASTTISQQTIAPKSASTHSTRNNALLTDNVASATKLADNTAFKAWGQTFFSNGVPKTVSGDMTGVGSITASGEIKSTSANAFRAVRGNYGFIINNSGNTTYFLLTDSGDQDGNHNDLFPFQINNSNGRVTMSCGLTVNQVAIGSCTIEYDTENTGLHFSKGIYSDSYVSALGVNTSSDARLKKIIRHVRLDIRDIANAPCVEFTWKKNGMRDIGSLAQHFHRINALLTPQMSDGSLTLQYGKTALLYLIPTTKKLIHLEEKFAKADKKIDNHAAEIKRLNEKIDKLNKKIAQLERR